MIVYCVLELQGLMNLFFKYFKFFISSIFEMLSDSKVNRMLLDIDDRFVNFIAFVLIIFLNFIISFKQMMFYDETQFQKYNMFNNFFFYDKKYLENFSVKAKNILILIDPPYGGLVKLISNTIKSILDNFSDKNVSVFLIYPYFMENWIKNWLCDFKMLDYKVSYRNQKKFSSNETIKKGSPARIFTNVSINKIQLPSEQGYYFCDICLKYTFEENKHCIKCNLCPSKDGFFYKHCILCKQCVKTSYDHCIDCKKCHLKNNCIINIKHEKQTKNFERKNNKKLKK